MSSSGGAGGVRVYTSSEDDSSHHSTRDDSQSATHPNNEISRPGAVAGDRLGPAVPSKAETKQGNPNATRPGAVAVAGPDYKPSNSEDAEERLHTNLVQVNTIGAVPVSGTGDAKPPSVLSSVEASEDKLGKHLVQVNTTSAHFEEDPQGNENEFEEDIPAPLPRLSRQTRASFVDTLPGAIPMGDEEPRSYPASSQSNGTSGRNGQSSQTFPRQPTSGLPGSSTNESPANDSDLAQARPVQEDAVQDMEAQPVDVDAAERRATGHRRQKQLLLLVTVLGLVIMGVVLAVTLGKKGEKPPTAPPSMSPSEAPTGVPSAAPTGSLDLFVQNLPPSAVERAGTVNSPQWKALNWLEDHPKLPGMEITRMNQLFALATFYYAMEGDNWPEPIPDNWLLDSTECQWWSAEFGNFNFGIWDEGSIYQYNLTTCNEQGEFEVLFLSELGLGDFEPYIPPEIALLTSLSILALSRNTINATLTAFLPFELYQLTQLTEINGNGNRFRGPLPTELGLLTNLNELEFPWNRLSGNLPSELGLLTSMTELFLHGNSMTGTIPNQLGMMAKMEQLWLNGNELTGQIPSELGVATDLQKLELHFNSLTGSIPSQLGLARDMVEFKLQGNSLSGDIPTALGLMTSVTSLHLDSNSLIGDIPSQFGGVTSLVNLFLNSNKLSGVLPSEIGLLTNLRFAWLDDNNLSGAIPQELDDLVATGSLTMLTLENNNLSGTISEELCSLGLLNPNSWLGLSFDCSEKLCGCCWCPCAGENATCSLDELAVFDPAKKNPIWPGAFPSPADAPNLVTINIHTDDMPWQTFTELTWSIKDEQFGNWKILETTTPTDPNSLFSYTKEVESGASYRLQISDTQNDGTCCKDGFGWFTVTNSTPSDTHSNGTVIWDAAGDTFLFLIEVFLQVDDNGHVQLIEAGYDPVESLVEADDEWPGHFPTPIDTPNVIMINIHTDEYPEETVFEWSLLNSFGVWATLETTALPQIQDSLFHYERTVASFSMYRMQLTDSAGDGTCCAFGVGWFTMTNSTPSPEYEDGTIFWKATGAAFKDSLYVHLWIDAEGQAHHVEYVPGQGYVFTEDGLVPETPVVAVPDTSANNSSKI